MSQHKNAVAWMLSSPALLIFVVMLLVPIALTFILSFHACDHAKGIQDELTMSHYVHVLSDPYYFKIFWRTLWISALTTLICAMYSATDGILPISEQIAASSAEPR